MSRSHNNKSVGDENAEGIHRLQQGQGGSNNHQQQPLIGNQGQHQHITGATHANYQQHSTYGYASHQQLPTNQQSSQWNSRGCYPRSAALLENQNIGNTMNRTDSQLSETSKPLTDEEYNELQTNLVEHPSR